MGIELARPAFLGLILLAPLSWWIFRRARGGRLSWPDRLAVALRTLLVALLALALAEPRVVTRTEARATAFLLDLSDSVPSGSREAASEWILRALRDRRPEQEDVSFIVFAEGTGIETPFRGLGGLSPEDIRPIDPRRVGSIIERGETDIEGALKAARASFPPGAAPRVVLLTDGNETRGDARAEVRSLRAAGTEVLVFPLRYRREHEVLVEKVVAPPRAKAGQPVAVRAVVVSTEEGIPASVMFSDARGRVITSSEVVLRKGRSVYEVKQAFAEQGLHEIRVSVSAPGDGDPANNHGTAAVYAEGSPAVLLVYRDEEEARNVADALSGNELFVNAVRLSDLPRDAGALLPYETVVLLNAPASEMSLAQMRMLRASVEETGIGLLAVGGPDSFTAGSYGGTPLEEVLPVTMDVTQKRVLPNGAIVVVLHTCEFPQGNDWARTIAKSVVRSLGKNDYFGCVDWEGGRGVNWVVELSKGDRAGMIDAIEKCNPMDMPSLADCIGAAVTALEGAHAYLKHMVVISDGDPAMPGPETVKRMVDGGITISAVAIAQHGMQDAMLPMTEATGGRYYSLNQGEVRTLPAIFMKEAAVVRRSMVFEEPFQPQVTTLHEILKGVDPAEIPPLGGYVVTSAKDRAEVLLVEPKNGDPVLAVWRKGVGVAAAFTSDLTGRWAKGWLAWDKYDKVVSQIVRACSRGIQQSTFSASVEASGGTGRAIVEAVDEEGNYVDGLAFDGRVIKPSGDSEDLTVLQTQQGRYEATFPATQTGLYLVSLEHEVPGGTPERPLRAQVRAALPVDYSAEHLALSSDEALLSGLEAAGARLLAPGDRPFLDALPETSRRLEIWRWLLLAAVVLFPLEVAARRLRLDPGPAIEALRRRLRGIRPALPVRRQRKAPVVVTTGATAVAGEAGTAADDAARRREEEAAKPAAPGEAPATKEPDAPPGATDDLLRAKRRARKRSRWEDNA